MMSGWLRWFVCSMIVLQQGGVWSFAPSSSCVSCVSRSVVRKTVVFAEGSDGSAAVEDRRTASSASASASAVALLKRDRYVATNRFAVREGKEGKFEQRWANRKSRLATLDGFQYFQLMRRVDANGEYVCEDESGEMLGNYVSFTVWQKKSHFSAWRKGEAFKEAHGGTSIGAFVSTLVNSAMTLKGAPRPAFYDGLLVMSMQPQPDELPTLVDGWRAVDDSHSDDILPPECFVAINQFFIPSHNAHQFEQRFANRESTLNEWPGFVGFTMMRRDINSNKGHGTLPFNSDNEPTYLSTTVWKHQSNYQAWRDSQAFVKAHEKDRHVSNDYNPKLPKPLWTKPPKAVFYQGKLVITAQNGI